MDDFPVPYSQVPKISMWSENYAYMVTDRNNGIAMVALLGRWTQDPTIWREFLVIGLPGERVVYHKSWGRATTETIASASLMQIGFPVQEMRHSVHFSGPVAEDLRTSLMERGVTSRPVRPARLEFIMEGVAPVWDISGHANDATDIAGRMHVEQVGLVNGILEYGGERFVIKDAFGQRDHSRGVRVVTQFYRHCWAQGHFPKAAVTFNIYVMEVHGGASRMAHATVSRGMERFSATVSNLSLMDSQLDGARTYSFQLDSELGKMDIRMAQVLISLPKTFTSPWDVNVGATPGHPVATAFEESVLWVLNGEEGLGWSERAFNPRPFTE